MTSPRTMQRYRTRNRAVNASAGNVLSRQSATSVPNDPAERRKWLSGARTQRINDAVRASLQKWYGAEKAPAVKQVEAFEICEYGKQPSEAEIRRLFPMLK